ncbi:hypothetical protein D9M73_269520 [compost metagenome]
MQRIAFGQHLETEALSVKKVQAGNRRAYRGNNHRVAVDVEPINVQQRCIEVLFDHQIVQRCAVLLLQVVAQAVDVA